MIQALGARVLRDACRQVMQWHRQNMLLRLSVNLSVQQLQHDSWLVDRRGGAARERLPARYLDLEITESVIITHPEKAVATLMKLKQMGVSITSTISAPAIRACRTSRDCRSRRVKIDQRFVHGLEQNRSDEAITQAIIALSHSLGLRVIAEGVETVAQFEFLKEHGCEEAQGFLISRPLEEHELRAWWKMQDEENRIVGRQADMWRRGVRAAPDVRRRSALPARGPPACRRRAAMPGSSTARSVSACRATPAAASRPRRRESATSSA